MISRSQKHAYELMTLRLIFGKLSTQSRKVIALTLPGRKKLLGNAYFDDIRRWVKERYKFT